MNVFTVSDRIILGRQTESGICTLQFPIAKWITAYGSGGTFHLFNKRPTDANAYPVTITSDETYVYWTPTATDLAYAGIGEAQLDYTFGASGTSTYRKACSEVFQTRIDRSIESSSTTPEPYTAWVTQVEGYADRAETAAEEAEESAEEAAASAASFHGIPAGGTTDQVLTKKSNTDYDVEWADSGGGGTFDFDSLTNRPSYNGSTMTHSTNIPEVKTANWDAAYNEAHEHSNKSIIDGITSALISAWNTASTWVTTNGANVLNHIADTVIHVTANDKTTWNAKADTEDIPTKTSQLTNDSGFLTEHQSLSAYRTSADQDVIDAAQNTEIANKMDKANPTGTGSFSLNRKSGTNVGTNSVAEGNNTTASGNFSHAEGGDTTASGNFSHAEGYNTTASTPNSHAEGYETVASATNAHAEGLSTTASGAASHAEGVSTIASGFDGHAEGQITTASGNYSHAEGVRTIAASNAQHVQGKYNVEDSSSTYADIVGWGSSDSARKNISALTTGGNLKLKGDLYTGCNDDSTGGTALSTALAAKANTADLADVATSGDAADVYFNDSIKGVLTVTDVQSAVDQLTERSVDEATKIDTNIGSKGYNQLCVDGNFTDFSTNWNDTTGGATATVESGIASFTSGHQYGGLSSKNNITRTVGHKYLILSQVKASAVGAAQVLVYEEQHILWSTNRTANAWENVYGFETYDGSGNGRPVGVQDTRSSGWDEIQVKNIMVFDLTLLYGSGNEPTTLAEFKADYPEDYYPYMALANYGVATKVDLMSKQDTITSTNKLSASLVDGLATVATSGSYNNLSDTPTIPSEVTESTVSGWGFTKNTGTVTSVGVKMNGSTKGTVTSSGEIDLGTVITSHQDISGKQDVTDSTLTTTAKTVVGAINELDSGLDTASAQIANKVDKETGKGLSANDYTTAEKNKLDGLCNITSIGAGLALTSAGVLKVATPNTWEDIQEVTRRGVASSVLTVGDSYTFTRDGTEITAKVMGFITEGGRNGSIKIKDGNLQYGTIFQTADCLYNLQFDEREAFYAAPSGGLAAGDYSFYLGAHSWYSADVGKTFYFTLANAVPEGAQFVFTQNYNSTLEGATVNIFNSPTTYTANQTTTLSSTEISGATSLGTLNNLINSRLNSCQRAIFGNNAWKDSAIRQQLNSDDAAGSVWSPQTIWDRPPSWRTSTKGFLNGLPSSFLDYVAECQIDTYRNTLCDGGGYDTTEDKFFLAGRMEVFMPSESSADNGAAWPFYKNNSSSSTPHTAADAIRVKALNGSATYWWLRSPYVGSASNVRNVSTTGADNGSNATNSSGVAPAFVIA